MQSKNCKNIYPKFPSFFRLQTHIYLIIIEERSERAPCTNGFFEMFVADDWNRTIEDSL